MSLIQSMDPNGPFENEMLYHCSLVEIIFHCSTSFFSGLYDFSSACRSWAQSSYREANSFQPCKPSSNNITVQKCFRWPMLKGVMRKTSIICCSEHSNPSISIFQSCIITQNKLHCPAKTWIYLTPYVCNERIFDSWPFMYN